MYEKTRTNCIIGAIRLRRKWSDNSSLYRRYAVYFRCVFCTVVLYYFPVFSLFLRRHSFLPSEETGLVHTYTVTAGALLPTRQKISPPLDSLRPSKQKAAAGLLLLKEVSVRIRLHYVTKPGDVGNMTV